MNRTVDLETRIYKNHDVTEIAKYLQFGINNDFHTVLGTTLSILKYGFNELYSNKENIRPTTEKVNSRAYNANKRNLEHLNARRYDYDYTPGDLVYVNRNVRGKTDSIREGPFRFIQIRAQGNNLLIETPDKVFWTNVNRVVPCGVQDVMTDT